MRSGMREFNEMTVSGLETCMVVRGVMTFYLQVAVSSIRAEGLRFYQACGDAF